MLKIFINLHCKMHWSAKAIDSTYLNLNSNIQHRVLKIDVTKNRFFWCISSVKGTLLKIHSPGNFLLVVVSFRRDMIIIQTMTIPYRMPNIDRRGMYTTIIPLSSMKSYDFECNLDEVNVMVTKNLVFRKVSSKWINVIHTEPLGKVPSPTVEVTFDLVRCECSRFWANDSFENRPFSMHLSYPYPMFLINNVLEYLVKEGDVRYLRKVLVEGIEPVLIEDPIVSFA